MTRTELIEKVKDLADECATRPESDAQAVAALLFSVTGALQVGAEGELLGVVINAWTKPQRDKLQEKVAPAPIPDWPDTVGE